jgi:hypothetical protein
MQVVILRQAVSFNVTAAFDHSKGADHGSTRHHARVSICYISGLIRDRRVRCPLFRALRFPRR